MVRQIEKVLCDMDGAFCVAIYNPPRLRVLSPGWEGVEYL